MVDVLTVAILWPTTLLAHFFLVRWFRSLQLPRVWRVVGWINVVLGAAFAALLGLSSPPVGVPLGLALGIMGILSTVGLFAHTPAGQAQRRGSRTMTA
jgi:hypothetical protein